MGGGEAQSALVRRLGYVRVSMAREEMISPSIQRAAITDDAKRTGRQVTGWIEDLDATGRNFRRRVMEAIHAIEAGEADEIGVYRYDRWGRNALECLANVQRVEDAGGAVVSAMERVDAETAMGRFTRRMAFDLAELQSDQISDNWRGVHEKRVRDGLPGSGARQFGYVRLGRIPDPDRPGKYRRDPDDPAGERYEPDPETGPVLADLYRRYANGEPVNRLVYWLNAGGIPTTTGGQWTRYTLRQVLLTGFGAGLLRIHDPACRIRPGRGRAKCGRYVYVPGAHEPVIGPEMWQAFLDRLEQRRETPPRLRDAVYPFSGLLWCNGYGHRLTVVTGAFGVAYRCTRKMEARSCPGAFVRQGAVEEFVLEWLSQWAADIEAAAAAETARRRTVTKAQAREGQLAGREEALQRKLARLYKRWADDENMEPGAYELARKPIQDDLDAVRAAMKDAGRAQAANTGEFVPVAAGLLKTWPLLPPPRKRELLAAMIKRVEVYRTGPRKPARLVIVPVWED